MVMVKSSQKVQSTVGLQFRTDRQHMGGAVKVLQPKISSWGYSQGVLSDPILM